MAEPPTKRVVSLIASATEIVCALGRRDWLVGRSHECDFPADVAALPALTAPKFKVEGTSAEIDARVQAIVREGLSVYRVDGEALKELAPDVIVTQDHCEVCAVSLSDVEAATCTWTGRPVDIVSLKPDSTADVYADIRRVARGLDAVAAGEALVADMQRRIDAVRARVAGRPRPRVAFIEWVEPLMAGGNWMPELIEAAGGDNLFGAAGKHSDWMQWERAGRRRSGGDHRRPMRLRPAALAGRAADPAGAPRLGRHRRRALGRVYFVDGNAYCNRPGPRLAETTEILAEMLHPGVAGSAHRGQAWAQRA